MGNNMSIPCGDSKFNPMKEQCCHGTTVKPSSESGGLPENPFGDDDNQDIINTMPCGQAKYNPLEEQCCFGEVLPSKETCNLPENPFGDNNNNNNDMFNNIFG